MSKEMELGLERALASSMAACRNSIARVIADVAGTIVRCGVALIPLGVDGDDVALIEDNGGSVEGPFPQ